MVIEEMQTILSISSPSRHRRQLEGQIEPDAQPGSDGAESWHDGMSPSSSLLLVLHVRGGVTEVAMEGVALTVLCGRGRAPLPNPQQGAAAGWAERTHDERQVMRVACGLTNTGESRGVGRNLRARGGTEDGGRREGCRTGGRYTAATSTKLI